MKRSWSTGFAALALTVASFAIGYGARSGSDDYGFTGSRMAQMLVAGSMQDRVREHRQLLNQLRSTMTPEMRTHLKDDRLWQMMQDDSLKEMMDRLGDLLRDVPGMSDNDAGTHGGGPIH